MKKGGRKRRRKYRRRRSFRRRRKPLNLRKRSLKNIQKGGGKTKFFSIIPLTEGEKKYTTTRGTYGTITSNILIKVEIEASKEFQTVVDILKSIITLRSPLLSHKELLHQSLANLEWTDDGELQRKIDAKNIELDGEGGLRRQWNNLTEEIREQAIRGIPGVLEEVVDDAVGRPAVREIKQAIQLKKRLDKEEKKLRKWSQQINMVANFDDWIDAFATLFETNRQTWVRLAREQKTLPPKLESIYLHWKNPTQRKIELLQKQEEEMETFPRLHFTDTRTRTLEDDMYKQELKLRHEKQIKHLDEKIKMEKQILTRALQSRIDLEKIKPFSCCTTPEEDEGKIDEGGKEAEVIPAEMRALFPHGEYLDDFITITITPLVLTGLESSMQNFSERMIQFTKEESEAWVSWGRDKAIKKWKTLQQKFDIPTDLPISVVEPDSYTSPFAFFVLDLDCGEDINGRSTSPPLDENIPVNPETASKLKQKRLQVRVEGREQDIHPVMLGSQISRLDFWDFVKLCLDRTIENDILDDLTIDGVRPTFQHAFPMSQDIMYHFRGLTHRFSVSFSVVNKDDKQIIEPIIEELLHDEAYEPIVSNPTNTVMRYIFNKENSPHYRLETMLFRQLGIDNTRPVYIRQIELQLPTIRAPPGNSITDVNRTKLLGPVLMPVPETMDDDEFARAIPDLTDTNILPRPIEEGDMARVKDNAIYRREREIAQEKTEEKTLDIGRGSWATNQLEVQGPDRGYMYKDYGIQDEQTIIIALKSVSKQNAEYEVFTYSIPEGAIKGYNAMENPFLTLDTKFIRRMKSSVLSSKENKSHLKYLRRMVIVPGKDDLLREQLEIKTIKFSENMVRDILMDKTQQILDQKSENEENVDVLISTLHTVPTLFWSSPELVFQFPILSDESKDDSEIPFSGFYKGVICMTHAIIPDELMREVFNNINISAIRMRDVREVDKGLFQYIDKDGNVIEMSEDARKKLEDYQYMKPTKNEIIKKAEEESEELMTRARKLKAEGARDEAQELENQAIEMVKDDNMKERYIKEQRKWIKGKRALELQIHETAPDLLEQMLEQICPLAHEQCDDIKREYETGEISHDEYFNKIRTILKYLHDDGTINDGYYDSSIKDLARLETRYKMKKQQLDVREIDHIKRNEQQLNILEDQRRGIEGKIKKETEKKDKAIMNVEIQLEKSQKQAVMDNRARNKQIDTLIREKHEELLQKEQEREEAIDDGQDDTIITEMSQYIETLKNDIQALKTEKKQSEEKLNRALGELESKSREDIGKITQEYNENKKVKKAIQEIKQIRREESDMLRVEETTEDTVATAETVDEDADLAEELEGLPTWDDDEDEELAGMVRDVRERGDAEERRDVEPPREDIGMGSRPDEEDVGGKEAVGGEEDVGGKEAVGGEDIVEEEGRKTGGLPRSRDGLPAGTKRIRRPWYNKIPSMTHEWYFLRPSQDDMTGQIDLRSAVDMDINTSSWLAGLGQPIDSLAPEDDFDDDDDIVSGRGRGRGPSSTSAGKKSSERPVAGSDSTEEISGAAEKEFEKLEESRKKPGEGEVSSTEGMEEFERLDELPKEPVESEVSSTQDTPGSNYTERLNKINETFQGLKQEIIIAITQSTSAINFELTQLTADILIIGEAREKIKTECLKLTNKIAAWAGAQEGEYQKAIDKNNKGNLTENNIETMEYNLSTTIPKVRADIEKLSNLADSLVRTSNL